MIATVQPQLVDPAEHGVRKKVFIEAHSPSFTMATAISPESFKPTVKFKVNLYTWESVRTNSGEMENKLVLYKSNDAIFKLDFWNSKYGAITPNTFWENIDQNLIDEIVYANTRTWTGNEIQIAHYWRDEIQDASGFEVVVYNQQSKQWEPVTN